MQNKKPGRPKGSLNHEIVGVVAEIPPQCPRCGSQQSRQLPGPVRSQVFGGVTRSGVEFEQIEWRRMRCDTCQGVFMKKTYLAKKNSEAE